MKINWHGVLEFLGDVCNIGFGIILTFQFVTIQVMGCYAQEPSKVILYSEIVMSVLIFVLGINRLISDYKRRFK